MVDDSPAEGHRGEEQGRPQRPPSRGLRREVASEAARILTRALDQVEEVLSRAEGRSGGRLSAEQSSREGVAAPDLSELRTSLSHVLDSLADAIDHVGLEGQRLSDGVAELALLTQRLDSVARLLERVVGQLAPAQQEAIPEAAPTPQEAQEPRFAAGSGLGLVIADVPGFQGLMEVQRGLSRLPAVENASVRRYQNGEASVELTLREPATASEIVDAIMAATGAPLLIEEARPEASRLRLRFAATA